MCNAIVVGLKLLHGYISHTPLPAVHSIRSFWPLCTRKKGWKLISAAWDSMDRKSNNNRKVKPASPIQTSYSTERNTGCSSKPIDWTLLGHSASVSLGQLYCMFRHLALPLTHTHTHTLQRDTLVLSALQGPDHRDTRRGREGDSVMESAFQALTICTLLTVK